VAAAGLFRRPQGTHGDAAEFCRTLAGVRWTLQQFAYAAESDAPPEVLDLIRAQVGEEDDADEPLTVAAQ